MLYLIVNSNALFPALKYNVCVVGQQAKAYLRENGIPHEYRSGLPAVIRDCQNHGALLMAIFCYQVSVLSNMLFATLKSNACAVGGQAKANLKVNVQKALLSFIVFTNTFMNHHSKEKSFADYYMKHYGIKNFYDPTVAHTRARATAR